MALGSATHRTTQWCSGYSYTSLSAIYIYRYLYTHAKSCPRSGARHSHSKSCAARLAHTRSLTSTLDASAMRQGHTVDFTRQAPCATRQSQGRRHGPSHRYASQSFAKLKDNAMRLASDAMRHAPVWSVTASRQSLASRSCTNIMRRIHRPASCVGVIRRDQRRAFSSCVTRHASWVERQRHASQPCDPA